MTGLFDEYTDSEMMEKSYKIEAPMGLIKYGLPVGVSLVALIIFQQQIKPTQNRLVFQNGIEEVADSISRMESLMEKFPETYMVNYFVDGNGYLYLSNQKIALIEGAIYNPKVRNDMVFRDFSDTDIDDFFYLMAYLWKNGIYACHEESFGKFVFSYGSERPKSRVDSRSIMIAGEPKDTLNANFTQFFQIIDKHDELVLFGPK